MGVADRQDYPKTNTDGQLSSLYASSPLREVSGVIAAATAALHVISLQLIMSYNM
jgi:hypothetical protein